MKPSYLEILSKHYPSVFVHTNGSAWEYASIIHDGGDQLPTKETLDELIAQQGKVDMWRVIQVERDRRTQGGVLVSGNWFHSDQPSRIQQIGLVLYGQNMSNNIMWKTMSGTFVQMTPQLAMSIFMAVAMKDMQVFGVAEQKRSEMLQLADPYAYEYMTGWPAIFGEPT